MKMLIVDDSSVIRRKIQREVESTEITEFCFASDGVEAVEVFREQQPEIVTMDLTMPKMNGVECVKQLVKLNPEVVILVISALADKATAIQAIKHGARGFLCKPFRDRELNELLTDMINDFKKNRNRAV